MKGSQESEQTEQPRQTAMPDSDMVDVDAGQTEQPRQTAQPDSDMADVDASQTMQSSEPEPEPSASLVSDEGSGFKEQVCAAYRGDPNFVNSEFTQELHFKDGLWFKDQALVVPKVGNLRQECMREMHDTPLSGHLGVTKTQHAMMRLFWWPTVRLSSSMC